jgi:hypothetical protein
MVVCGWERGGELTSRSKSGDHRLQNLGHNGEERDGRERELCAGELNEGKRGKGREGRGTRARVGPGWVASRVKIPRHAQPQVRNRSRNEIQNETKQNTQQNTT